MKVNKMSEMMQLKIVHPQKELRLEQDDCRLGSRWRQKRQIKCRCKGSVNVKEHKIRLH